MEFSERLRRLIKNTGLKREEFAEKTGKSRTQIFKYLGGEQSPTADFFQAIKKEFPWINIEWLITGEGEMEVSTPPPRSQIATGNGHVQIGGKVSGQGVVIGNRARGHSKVNDSAKTQWPMADHPMQADILEICKLLEDYGTPKLLKEIRDKLIKIKDAMK